MAVSVLLLPLAGCVRNQAATSVALPPDDTPWEEIDPIIEKGIAEKVYPGAVVVIGEPGRILYSKAYGKHTYDADAKPMEMDSMFDLASVSKVMGTTTAALCLLEDGMKKEEHTISLSDRASKYINGFEAGGKETVTIQDLMTHTSGLKAYESKDSVEKERMEGETHDAALIRRYASLTTSYEPRKDYKYSCLNFQTMARIVENASGERMEDLLKRRVYGPLGMEDTVYVLNEDQRQRAVPTQIREDGSLILAEVHDPLANYHGSELHCPGNAGLFSTAPDAAKYCEMILNGGELNGKRVFQPETIAMATTVQTPSEVNEKRGLGFDVWESKPYVTDLNNSPETYIVGHTGYTGTLIWIDKLSDTYLVFFTNRTFPDDNANSSKGVAAARKALCDFVLHHRPEYEEYFAAEETGVAAGQ